MFSIEKIEVTNIPTLNEKEILQIYIECRVPEAINIMRLKLIQEFIKEMKNEILSINLLDLSNRLQSSYYTSRLMYNILNYYHLNYNSDDKKHYFKNQTIYWLQNEFDIDYYTLNSTFQSKFEQHIESIYSLYFLKDMIRGNLVGFDYTLYHDIGIKKIQ